MAFDLTPAKIAKERARLEYTARTEEVKLRIDTQVRKLEGLFKSLTLINGGAIVALFTLIGNSDKAHLTFVVNRLWWSFGSFVVGLVLTIAALAFSVIGQYHLSIRAKRQAWNEQARMFGLPDEHDSLSPFERSERYNKIMWLTALFSLVAFVIGAMFAMSAMLPVK